MSYLVKLLLTFWLVMSLQASNQLFSTSCEILGIGGPSIDLLMPVTEEFIRDHKMNKGASIPVEWETFRQATQDGNIRDEHITTGGCTSNTLKGLAKLGRSCCFFGRIGQDAVSEKVYSMLAAHSISSKFILSELATQQILCMITPDHERTFYAYHGAAAELCEEDLYPELFANTKIVHIEGYQLPNGRLVETAFKMAKQAGAKTSFDLGTYLLVQKNKERLLELLKDVDIIFANREEAESLTGVGPEESCDILRNMCEIAVVLNGSEGCWVGTKHEKVLCPAFQVEVVDTTGAGDLFASGFLHAYLKGCSLAECGRFGNLLGSLVIQNYGAEIPEDRWMNISL